MPLFSSLQPKRTVLFLRATLLVALIGGTRLLQAQQLVASSSSSSVDEPAVLPDSPSAVLELQSGQTTSTSSTPQTATTPDPTKAPQTTDNPDAVSPNGNHQTKRVLGLVPNFRTVSADIKLPPMSPKEKFIVAGKDTFDYSALFVAGVQAGISMNSKSYPEFGQGLKGYGQYYWHTLADTASENFFVGGIGPIVFKQDNRFYTLGHGSFGKRSWYAVTRVLVTRKDDGSETFNSSEIIGSGASAGLSTLWYPKQYQTWTKVGQKWLTSDLIDCFNFWWKEWWPTANKYVFHQQN